MRPLLLVAPAALALMLVAGCGARDNDPGPGGVTVGEARALDEAAEMLEARRGQPLVAAPTPAPAARSSSANRVGSAN